MNENENTGEAREPEQYVTEDPNWERRMKILANTPDDVDPVCYWHQVAMDAIRSADKEREKGKDDRDRLGMYERAEKNEHLRKERELRRQTLPPMYDLLEHVRNGDFSMTLNLAFYPNNDRKGEE